MNFFPPFSIKETPYWKASKIANCIFWESSKKFILFSAQMLINSLVIISAILASTSGVITFILVLYIQTFGLSIGQTISFFAFLFIVSPPKREISFNLFNSFSLFLIFHDFFPIVEGFQLFIF